MYIVGGREWPSLEDGSEAVLGWVYSGMFHREIQKPGESHPTTPVMCLTSDEIHMKLSPAPSVFLGGSSHNLGTSWPVPSAGRSYLRLQRANLDHIYIN